MFKVNLILIGLGGTGSILVAPLLSLLKYHSAVTELKVLLADGDDYETRNLTRQMTSTEGIGINKAEYQCSLHSSHIPDISFTPEYISKMKLQKVLLRGWLNLVISCVDNNSTRKENIEVLNESTKDFLFMTPGNELTWGQCSSYGRYGDNYFGIDPSTYQPNIQNPIDTTPVKGGCMLLSESSPQLITANFMAAGTVLVTLQNWLDGEGLAHRVEFDLRKYKMNL